MKEKSGIAPLKKYIFSKLLLTIGALAIVVLANILLNYFAGDTIKTWAIQLSFNYFISALAFFVSELFLGIFPAELFMMLYQFKEWNEFLLLVLGLGIISVICASIAFSAGKHLRVAKFTKLVVMQKKFKIYSDLFIKYGWVILILAATTPLPFSLLSFICGYLEFSQRRFLLLIIPVRIIRFFISAFFIKYSVHLVL